MRVIRIRRLEFNTTTIGRLSLSSSEETLLKYRGSRKRRKRGRKS